MIQVTFNDDNDVWANFTGSLPNIDKFVDRFFQQCRRQHCVPKDIANIDLATGIIQTIIASKKLDDSEGLVAVWWCLNKLNLRSDYLKYNIDVRLTVDDNRISAHAKVIRPQLPSNFAPMTLN